MNPSFKDNIVIAELFGYTFFFRRLSTKDNILNKMGNTVFPFVVEHCIINKYFIFINYSKTKIGKRISKIKKYCSFFYHYV